MKLLNNSNYIRASAYLAWTVCLLGIIYAGITLAGLVSLASPSAPIGQPYLMLMEIIILLIAPLMAISMVAVHYHIHPPYKMYSLAAVCLLFAMAALTSVVHFIVLIAGDQLSAQYPSLFGFRWPSLVYALDILAWDFLWARNAVWCPRVRKGKLEKTISALMITSGLLSIGGLLGIPLKNMEVRNIGIVGYAVFGPLVFLLSGIWIKKKNSQTPAPIEK